VTAVNVRALARGRHARIVALGASTVCALALLFVGLRWIRERREVPIVARVNAPPPPPRPVSLSAFAAIPGEHLAPRAPEEWAYYLAVEEVRAIYLIDPGSTQYDPWSCVRRVAGYAQPYRWPEHPAGGFWLRTNSLGLREDRELADPPAEWRVLVTGDSHTEGVCENAETFANLLEAELARRSGRSTEVLNAASGAHTVLNYFGTWLRLRDFRPRVLVVAVFGGNDFSNLLMPFLTLTGRACPPSNIGREARRLMGATRSAAVFCQIQEQVETTRSIPRLMHEVAREAARMCAEIARSARAAGTEVVVLYIPSPFEIGAQCATELEREVADLMELLPGDFAAAEGLTRTFLDELAVENVRVVDLRAAFAAEPSRPYWKRDLHMDLRGHELAAQALLPVVEPLLERAP
jgi:lysophospholipase L1-like esterase